MSDTVSSLFHVYEILITTIYQDIFVETIYVYVT